MSIANKLATIAENEQKVYDAGKKAEYDAFWDIFQENGARKTYSYAFYCDNNTGGIWNDNNFKPKYNMVIGTSQYAGDCMFQYCPITNLKGLLEKAGVMLDFSKTARLNATFYMSKVTKPPPIDASSCASLVRPFYNAASMTDIEINNLQENCAFDRAFGYASALKNLKITGTIGQNGLNFSQSTKLTLASLQNIISCLKDYSADTSGTSWVVTVGSTNLKKLTDADLENISKKGWTFK